MSTEFVITQSGGYKDWTSFAESFLKAGRVDTTDFWQSIDQDVSSYKFREATVIDDTAAVLAGNLFESTKFKVFGFVREQRFPSEKRKWRFSVRMTKSLAFNDQFDNVLSRWSEEFHIRK